ncbi:hypothetical protein Tco_0838102 [Tanacetum coccineum]|uniref:Retrovirus-related Pol polyprotein from transposon TNT 1-94-like beta-barrel domain-containing protein n=1 Tax=Tanacetum coccineum TaxID=301880 RepID=A0ABQ5ALS9_9ASTR
MNYRAKKESSNEECLTSESEEEEYSMGLRDFKKFFKRRVDLEPDEWIKDSGCSKHMTGNQKLFSSYKAYNGGNIIFGSNLRGNIIGKEPKNANEALADESWIVAIQEELNQFIANDIQLCRILRIPRLHTLLFPAHLEGYQILDPQELLDLSTRDCPGCHHHQTTYLAPRSHTVEAITCFDSSYLLDSPGYIPESGPEEDPEEDDDEDPKEDPANYPADGEDDGDEPSNDDEDEEVDIEADDEEEEEHPAPADSTAVALPAIDQAPSAKETKPFETDESAATPPPHPAYRITSRISIPALVPTPVWFDAEVARLLAISTPPSSPLSLWSSPLPQIPAPPLPPILSPLPVSPPLPQIPSPPLLLRAEAASTSYSLPLLPPIILSHTRPDAPSSGTPPLHLLFIDRKGDRPEVTLPPRKRLGIALGPGYEVGESSSATAARPARGLRIVEAIQGTLVVTDVAEFSQRMIEFETRVRQDTNEIYTRLDDEQSERQLMAVLAQQSEIRELQSADYRRQTVIIEMLAANHRRQEQLTKPLKLVRGLTGLAMINQGVTVALAARDANTNGVDNHNSGTRARRNERATHECTYPDFMKCQPLNFKGTEGVVKLTQWIEKMETVFRINNCFVENQIKFSTCTLLGNALTW